MFGYVTICEPELKVKDLKKYRGYYCGLCRVLKEEYGFMGQMTLTYDMTFAIILLSSLYEDTADMEMHPEWHDGRTVYSGYPCYRGIQMKGTN